MIIIIIIMFIIILVVILWSHTNWNDKTEIKETLFQASHQNNNENKEEMFDKKR